jgi:hypothetical protein
LLDDDAPVLAAVPLDESSLEPQPTAKAAIAANANTANKTFLKLIACIESSLLK